MTVSRTLRRCAVPVLAVLGLGLAGCGGGSGTPAIPAGHQSGATVAAAGAAQVRGGRLTQPLTIRVADAGLGEQVTVAALVRLPSRGEQNGLGCTVSGAGVLAEPGGMAIADVPGHATVTLQAVADCPAPSALAGRPHLDVSVTSLDGTLADTSLDL